MRYFLIFLLLATAGVVSVAGLRGGLARKPPREIFPDMKRQPKLRPQKPNGYFSDNTSSRLPVPGTVALGAPYQDLPINTGFEAGTTNFVAVNPAPITAQLLARGQERFTIFCTPCHSDAGDGNGITTKYGMLKAGNFHEPRLVRLADGELFHTITMGKNQMASYAAQVPVPDRWAIVAYIRALQRTRLGVPEDVPAENRAALKP
jgi:mono/diheme cytochrome c family protein